MANALGYLGREFLTKFVVATIVTGTGGGIYNYATSSFLNKEGAFVGF